jgi:DNA-binding transcriptional MocR family regulator
MARYHEIADDLRTRIQNGEWQVGDKLPGIAALQTYYRVEQSLGTIRKAQQLLVADGMLRTEQGLGAFVTATRPTRPATDVRETLTAARDLLDSALAALPDAKDKVTFDLSDQDTYSVLTNALNEYASRARSEAQDAADDNDPFGNLELHRRHAETAESLLDAIEA